MTRTATPSTAAPASTGPTSAATIASPAARPSSTAARIENPVRFALHVVRGRPAPSPSSPPSGGITRGGRQPQAQGEPGRADEQEQDVDRSEKDRVKIFDTTLRDGEQSPGISLNKQEKLEIAHQLARLGVDIIEAGFPIASPGDFDAVQAIAREVHGPVICGLARTGVPGHRRRLERGQGLRAAAHPHVHLDQRHPHHPPAADHARGREGPGPGCGGARPAVLRRRRVLADGRHARRPRVHRRGAADRARRGRDDDQRAGHRRLRDARRVRARCGATLYELVPDLAKVVDLRPLPQRPGAGRCELVRGRVRRRAPGRMRRQRHRRARRQRVARGDRDADAHARVEPRAFGPAPTRARSRARPAWSRG